MSDPDRHDVPRGGRSGFALVGGSQVHYLEWGGSGAPPVLALHGGGQTAYMYEELGAALRGSHHVLAPDLPSHGESDTTPTIFSRHALAATLPPLLDEFGLERVVVVGASLGGMLAITLGASHPDRVAGAVLVDVGHRLEEEGVRRVLGFMREHSSFGSLDEAAAAIAAYTAFRTEGRRESLTRNLRRRDDGRWVWKHAFGRGQADDDWRRLVAGLDDEAASLRMPVLVLRGAYSDVLSGEGAEELAALVPGARFETVERAGHLVAGDNPGDTVGAVTGFLRDLGW